MLSNGADMRPGSIHVCIHCNAQGSLPEPNYFTQNQHLYNLHAGSGNNNSISSQRDNFGVTKKSDVLQPMPLSYSTSHGAALRCQHCGEV